MTAEGQDILQALANGALPQELILTVMQHVVMSKCPTVKINRPEGLSNIRRAVLGISEASNILDELFEEALIKTARVHHDIEHRPNTTASRTAYVRRRIDDLQDTATSNKLPAYLTLLLHGLRHLELACTTRVSCEMQFYPNDLFRIQRIMTNLSETLPRLQSLTLYLEFNATCRHLQGNHASWDQITVRRGFADFTTLRVVLEDVLAAFVDQKTAKIKLLNAHWVESEKESDLKSKKRVVDASGFRSGSDLVPIMLQNDI